MHYFYPLAKAALSCSALLGKPIMILKCRLLMPSAAALLSVGGLSVVSAQREIKLLGIIFTPKEHASCQQVIASTFQLRNLLPGQTVNCSSQCLPLRYKR